MRCATIFIFVFSFSIRAYAQYAYTDFQKEDRIEQKAEIGLYLWNEYLRNSLDTLKITAVDLLIAADDNQNRFAQAVGARSLGSYFIRTGRIKKGISYLDKAKKYFDHKNDFLILSETDSEIGIGYYLLGNYDEATKFLVSSISNGKRSVDATSSFAAKLTLGKVYCAIGDTTTGLLLASSYKDEALEHNKYESAADGLAYMGMIAMERGELKLANELYSKSVNAALRSSSKVYLSHALNNKAIMFFNLGQIDSSLIYFEESLSIRKEMNHKKGMAESYFNLANFYWDIGESERAYDMCNSSVETARSSELIIDEIDALEMLLDLSKELKNGETASIGHRLDYLTLELNKNADLDAELFGMVRTIIASSMPESEIQLKSKPVSIQIVFLIIPIALLAFLMIRKLSERKTN